MRYYIFFVAMIYLLLTAGCVTSQNKEFNKISQRYRPSDTKPPLPILKPDSPSSDFLIYALLNNPRVESAFYDWKATIEESTVARYQLYPKLTLSAEIERMVMAFLTGLIAEIIWPEKPILRGDSLSFEARKKRYIFENEILTTLLKVKKTIYEAMLLEDKIQLTKEIVILLEALESLIEKNLSVAKGVEAKELVMVQMEKERLQIEVVNLEDARKPLMSRWREALGIPASDPDPPLPIISFPESILLQDEDLLKSALSHNLRLKALEEEVRQAEVLVKLAYRENYPDFSTGLKIDTKKDPLVWMPELSATLPLWHKKISAQISSAIAREKQTRAILTDAEIKLVVLLAEKSFIWRESNRQVKLLKEQLIPKAKVKVDTLAGSQFAGMDMFADLLNAKQELLELEIRLSEALAQREIAFTEVSLITLSHWPEEIGNIFKE